ncbi:MAG: hypothetical protein ACRCX7_11580 [Cetobacterium sp.]|uniref:hypothetical protein n=1 Tax=Cetobacterium sp. TaxID=2071632 RepID=UPI003F2A9184
MPSYNLGNIRISANEENTVNGTPYIDVARGYYYSNMYSENLGVIDDLFDESIPVFNAVPKVVNIASALAIGGDIEPCYEDSEYVQMVIDKLALEQEKTFMCRDLILGKSILVEIQSLENRDEDEPETAFDDTEFPYTMSYYPSDEYEIVSEGNKILWAKIKGIKLQLNDEGTEYEEVEVEKIYIRKDDGTAESYVMQGDEKSEEVVYEDGILPLVEITTTYDMKQLFYSVDRHNELESFIRNILYLAGEPILAGMGLDKINTSTAETINSDRYKKLKALFSKSENAKLQMLEIQGSSARIMIEKQKSIVEAIVKDYPEYSISEVLSGSNVSEETTRIRLTEILSRVSEVRRNMEIGLNNIIGIIAFLDGKEIEKNYVTFGSMTDSNTKEILDMVILAMQNGLISRKSAMYQIKTLYIGEDIDTELKAIESDISAGLLAPIIQNEGGMEDNGNKQGSSSGSNSGTDR